MYWGPADFYRPRSLAKQGDKGAVSIMDAHSIYATYSLAYGQSGQR